MVSLAIGLAFVRGASKETYAAYTLVYAAVLLFQNVQNALIISPMMTVVPGKTAVRRARWMESIARVQFILNGLLLFVWLLAGAAFVAIEAFGPPVGLQLLLAGSVAMLGLLIREFGRGQAFLERRPMDALIQDLVFGTLALTAIAYLYLHNEVSAEAVLLSSGASAFLVGVLAQVRRLRSIRRTCDSSAERLATTAVVRELWTCGRWALPSVFATWGYANGYVYLVAALASANVVADLAATRLVLAPVPLLLTAWFNVFRPRASAWYAEGRLDLLLRMAKGSALALAGAGAALGVLAYFSFPLIERYLLGARYAGLAPLMLGWAAFFVLTAVRGVGMGAVLSSSDGFRLMHHYTWITLVVALSSVSFAAVGASSLGVLLALAVAELCGSLLVWGHGWPTVRRQRERGVTPGMAAK